MLAWNGSTEAIGTRAEIMIAMTTRVMTCLLSSFEFVQAPQLQIYETFSVIAIVVA
jgi:hypothetical protein